MNFELVMNLDNYDFNIEWKRFKAHVGDEEFFIDASLSEPFTLDVTANKELRPLINVQERVFEIFVDLGLIVMFRQFIYEDFYKINPKELA